MNERYNITNNNLIVFFIYFYLITRVVELSIIDVVLASSTQHNQVQVFFIRVDNQVDSHLLQQFINQINFKSEMFIL